MALRHRARAGAGAHRSVARRRLRAAGLAFARRQWGVVCFSLEVAAFNQRAIAVYERLEFVETGRVSRAAPELAGAMVEFIEMAVASDGVAW